MGREGGAKGDGAIGDTVLIAMTARSSEAVIGWGLHVGNQDRAAQPVRCWTTVNEVEKQMEGTRWHTECISKGMSTGRKGGQGIIGVHHRGKAVKETKWLNARGS